VVTKNTSVTLDGKSKFTLDDTYTWKSSKLDYVSFHSGEVKQDVTVTLNLASSGWLLRHVEGINSPNLMTVINDKTGSAGATIGSMTLSGGLGNNVTLTNTHVDMYEGSNAADHVTIGAGGVDMLNVVGGNNSVKIGTGKVHSILAYDGNDKVTTGSGTIDSIDLGDGKNTITTGKGVIQSILTGKGDDTVTVGGGVSMMNLGDGDNVVNVTGKGNVGTIMGDTGDDTVNITGAGSVAVINLAKGDNVINTGTGTVSAIVTYLGNQTIHVGTGGAGVIRLSDGNSHVEADGHVGQLMAGPGDKSLIFHAAVGTVDIGGGTNTIVFGGQYVDALAITDGTDTITLQNGCNLNQVVTGDDNDIIHAEQGEVGTAQMGTGDDAIYTGAASIGHASMGTGNDTVYFGKMTDLKNDSTFNGGSGTDTMSFQNVGVSITASLGENGAQATSAGTVRFWNFEELIGGSGADTLTGSNGADILGGGKGDGDKLTGGGGVDTFIFNTGDGKDEITDFDFTAREKIDLSGVKGITDFNDLKTHFSSDGAGGTIIDFGGGDQLTIDHVSSGRLSDANFIF
jgi:Ca2+-binding RTX toxin-like protein